MPTYEYQCLDCGRKVEYFQSMKEAPRTVCQRCGGRLVRLVSSGAGLIFKGSGFYITDYKHKETGYGKHTGGNGHIKKHESKEKNSNKTEKSKADKSTIKSSNGG